MTQTIQSACFYLAYVLLDNVRRYPDTLDEYNLLVCSYEFMKPLSPDVNNSLAAWVQNGGVLVYVGDGSDPFHTIRSWWTGRYDSPVQHLTQLLGIGTEPADGTYACGKGHVIIRRINPMHLCIREDLANEYKQTIHTAAELLGTKWVEDNKLIVRRGNHIVIASLLESDTARDVELDGLFADMYSPDFAVCEKVVIRPDESRLLFDFAKIEKEHLRIIGTCVRVLSLEEQNDAINLTVRGAEDFKAYMRLRVPVEYANAIVLLDGEKIQSVYCEKSRTLLLTFDSHAGERNIVIKK